MPEPLTSRGPPTCSPPGCPSHSPGSRASPTTTAGRGRPGALSSSGPSIPTAGSAAGRTPCACCRRPTRRCVERAAADTALHERIAAVQAEVEADLARPDAEGDSVAYFCAEFGVHRSLPIYSGGLGALAGDILKEASDLARADGRRRPDVPPGLLPPAHRRGRLAARVLGRHGPGAPPGRAGPRRRRRAAHDHRARSATWRPSRRSGASTSAASRSTCSTRSGRRTRTSRAGSRRGSTSATPTRASPSTCCSAPAASARSPRWASSRDLLHLNEGHGAFVSLEAARAHGGTLEEGLEADAPSHDLHHPHAGPGRQRHLSGRPGRRGARGADGGAGRRGRRRSSGSAARAPPTRASRSASASSRCARAAPPTA